MLLEHAGYNVTEITGGGDPDDFVAAGTESQAIIADFDVGPGMTGIEVALELMRRTGRRIPTLVLSASFGERSLAAAAAHDMPVMFKPAHVEQVLTWVANALNRQREQPPCGAIN